MTVAVIALGLQIVVASLMICITLGYVASTICDAIKGIPGWKPYAEPKKENEEGSRDS